MIPVLKKQIPVKIHAHRADDICSAIRLGKEFDICVTLEHCSDGDRIAPILEREKLPVMLGPTLSDRSKPELKNLTFDTYKNLSDRGIDVAIITDHPEITIENLSLCAVMSVKNGMDEEKALKAISASLPTSSVPTLSSIQQFFAAVEVKTPILQCLQICRQDLSLNVL